MSFSSLLVDYLGAGIASARPASLAISVTTVGIYFATDTGDVSFWNGTASSWLTIPGQVSNSPLVFPIVGKPAGGAILALVPAVQKTLIPADLAGTVLTVNSAGDLPTSAASVNFAVLSSGTWSTVGAIGISTSGVLSLPTFSAITLNPANGDALRLTYQATADATFGNFAFGIQTQKVPG